MITSTAFAGKRYAVLGLARSGLATVEALLASGARVTAWDDDEKARAKLAPSPQREEGRGEGAPRSRELTNADHPHQRFVELPPAVQGHAGDMTDPTLSLQGEGLEVTDFTAADLTQFDSIVVTPGLPLNRHPIAARARAAGVEIIGDIELFARARAELPPHKVVGITGTNGKSTTTALVHHILRTAGVPSLMGGNIGLPILAQDPLPEGGVYVLELSSYQLDLTQSLDCDVAVLLNITPDHLDRYESFDAYAASKFRLVEMQTSEQRWIATDDPVVVKLEYAADDFPHPNAADRSFFAATGSNCSEVSVFDGVARVGTSRIGLQRNWPSLQGPHNAQNAAVASAVGTLLGLDLLQLSRGLRTYSGLLHRMERILNRDGILFVNDSKATNPSATGPALAAFPTIRWILGGQAKSDSLDECAPHFSHVRKGYTIGEASELFARLLREARVEVAECGTLEAAVKAAAADAQPGDTVLLSPACASFDQFRDFEARGDAFRAAVEAL